MIGRSRLKYHEGMNPSCEKMHLSVVFLWRRIAMRKTVKTSVTVPTTNLILAGLFLALSLALPFLTGQIPQLGNKLLPMHIPVLLCGFLCGPRLGLLVGFTAPLLRSFLFSMPVMFPMAVSMSLELAVYGFAAGLLYQFLPHKSISVYISLIISMLCGRLVWGAVSYILFGIAGTAFTWQIFTAGAFLNAVPGIIIQIILIPVIVLAIERHGVRRHGANREIA